MMRWIGVVAVLLWAMSGAWAQAADPSSSFAPFEQWKAKHQKEASKDQKAAFEKSSTAHKH